ncbi:hypothetical protein CSV75_07670 [Sporosarcina sp. P18a]|uniref:hypothetical protein n=1 Tax=Sporosarcina sp. P18a TaxID=2048259 RepID=UPI000C16281C|nr:hypothetical protein [Sporosarcina sp. P18a]PIC79849.1 hypothetical protein CSV75_07670 [Sporosarcina sp. P18a]
MAIYEEMAELQSLYFLLRENTYDVLDSCGSTNNDLIIMQMPGINDELLEDMINNLESINDELKSSLLNNIIEYLDPDSKIMEYVNFDEESFQMNHINDISDGDEENLSIYQNEAAQLTGERKLQLWHDAYDDFQYLMETLFPRLFDVSDSI